MALAPNPDTDWLIAQAKRFESLATSSQTFNDEDLVEFFNAELQAVVTPIVQSVNEEFGVMVIDYPISSLTETGSIRIPSQATGARLRNVQYVSNQGYITNVPRLMPDALGQANWAINTGFYVRNNEIVFYPGPPTYSSGFLRLTYFRRSNQLTETINTGRVIDIDTIGSTITLDNSPVGTDWVVGQLIDIIIGTSPFDFRARSVVIVNILGAVIEIQPSDIDGIEIGDYVALAGFTPVAQFVPMEAMQLLAQLGATRCLQSLGDTEGFKISFAKAEQMKQHLINLISDRVEGQPKRIVPRRRAGVRGGYYGGSW